VARTRILILGAAGRDFHDFNVAFRGDASSEVVAFTATQIPGIAGRRYPPELSGPLYPEGIPIVAESDLERLVRDLAVDEVVLSYSDLAHTDVMHLASRSLAAGAAFRLLSPRKTMLPSRVPVVAVTAVRTGAGKSQIARALARALRREDRRVVVARHPMPYGDLRAERVQRFATPQDLDRAHVTVEEREEYEPHLANGTIVYAGVDYAAILEAAEREADLVIWDGGNNDVPFFAPKVWIAVADPHRAGHELTHHPGETNLRSAGIIVVNKVDSATADAVARVRANVERVRPGVPIVHARSAVTVDDPSLVRGKRVLLVDDGPTLTHGGMPAGAAKVAADRFGAASIVDPRPVAVGRIAETYAQYPHIGPVLPAMGYSDREVLDLEATIARVDCDTILIGSPIDLAHLVRLPQPSTRVRYEVDPEDAPRLVDLVERGLGAS
jgi:predicted GTPase